MTPSKRQRSLTPTVWILAAAFAFTAASGASAAETYTFTLLLEGSMGGAVQESDGSDSGLDNSGFQLGFSVVGTGEVHVGGRVGSMDFDEGLGGLGDASLDYVTLGGDYRFFEGFYDSGVFIGLGYYEVEGVGFFGEPETDSSLGVALGLTGEFEINPRTGLQLELTSHVTDLGIAELFLTFHAGLAIHF